MHKTSLGPNTQAKMDSQFLRNLILNTAHPWGYIPLSNHIFPRKWKHRREIRFWLGILFNFDWVELSTQVWIILLADLYCIVWLFRGTCKSNKWITDLQAPRGPGNQSAQSLGASVWWSSPSSTPRKDTQPQAHSPGNCLNRQVPLWGVHICTAAVPTCLFYRCPTVRKRLRFSLAQQSENILHVPCLMSSGLNSLSSTILTITISV